MTGEDDIRLRLLQAAEGFPLRGRPADVRARVAARRQRTAGFAVAASALVVAGIAGVIAVAAGTPPGPERGQPPGVAAAAEYIGSSWRLTLVTDGAKTTPVPAAVGARMDLFADGRVVLDDGTNVLSGRFTTSGDGFDVHDVGSTFALYGGDDPPRLAAIAGLNTLAYGNRDGVTASGPAHVTVVSAAGTELVVRAGAYRLTFQQAGAPSETRPDRTHPSGPPASVKGK